jgi:hypothetical protein
MLRDWCENGSTIFHIHIPRTGGSSLNSFFSEEEYFINGHHSFNKRCYCKGRVNVYNPKKRGSFPSYEDVGFKLNMGKVSLVRNPFTWLHSYYQNSGLQFKFLPFSGWQGANTCHKINSYSEFLERYLDKGLDWHIPLLKQSQIGQLYNEESGQYEYDLFILGENLDCYLKECYPERDVTRVNVNEYDEYQYSNNEIRLMRDHFHDFFNLTEYDYKFVPTKKFIEGKKC